MGRVWSVRGREIICGRRGLLMGILNVTPDSFSDGGQFESVADAMRHASHLIACGADIIDVGGESTRPGADAVLADEETRRTLPVITALVQSFKCLVSIDTSKAQVASAALAAGAHIVNDVTALRGDVEMAHICSQYRAGVILMHMKGTPRTMQQNPQYTDVVKEVREFLLERRDAALSAGVAPDALVFDPGIGFGKTTKHNLTLLRNLERVRIANRPVLIGFSRKRFIGHVLGEEAMGARKWPSVALTSLMREFGADIVRVHDVAECHDALRVTEAVLAADRVADSTRVR